MGSGPGGFGVEIVRSGAVLPGTPNAIPDLCVEALPIVVPLRSSASGAVRAARERFKLQIRTATARDTDSVKLTCLPSTCGNGTIEADHEQCDDGNRANGDGYDQSCQSE